MTNEESRITLHMVCSLDGFIAKKDNSIDWMKSQDEYEKGASLTDEYIQEFIDSIDCYIMGAKTYAHALNLGWPYGDKPVFVFTKHNLQKTKPTVQFYNGDMADFVNSTIKLNYNNSWLVGGSALAKSFLQKDLVDEIVISIMPVLLGDGTLFFDFIGKELQLHLKDNAAYKDGMVELTYEVKK